MNDSIDALRNLGATLRAENLTWGSSGNLSLRTPRGVVMTASGSRLSDLRADDCVTLDAEGAPVDAAEGKKPSKEFKMHLAVYRQHESAGAVVHTSPPYTTFVSCTSLDLPRNAFPEGMMQLRDVARVPYCHAGSRALADAVEAASRTSSVLILENHGALVWAENVDDALLKLQVLEFAARLAYLQSSSNATLREQPEEVVDAFRKSGYKR